MDKPKHIEAYVYGLETMLEEAQNQIADLQARLAEAAQTEKSLREGKQGLEERLGEIINE